MQQDLGYFKLGGTIRARRPEDTLAWARKVCPKLGITRIANVTGLDTIGIPVYVSIRPNAKHLSVSQGKGISPALAQVSAVMESIEVYHVENARPPALVGCYNDLQSEHNIIAPDKIHNSFFAGIDWSKREIGWALGKELFSDQDIYFPHVLTTLDSSYQGSEKVTVLLSSNGLASGNCLNEAICHAIYEVIERDSLYRWAQLLPQEREVTRLNLDTIKVDKINWLLERYKEAGILVKTWDISSKVGLPAFHTIIQDSNPLRPLGRFHGTGAHICREVALMRSLTEAAQSRLTLISGSRDDVFPGRYHKQISRDQTKVEDMLENGKRDFTSCIQPEYGDDFTANVKQVLEMLSGIGIDQAIMFDHTREDLKVPVVQVFVPGLLYNPRGA